MALVINDGCVSCGACAGECPVGAISEGRIGKYEINLIMCVECGACAATCPYRFYFTVVSGNFIRLNLNTYNAKTAPANPEAVFCFMQTINNCSCHLYIRPSFF